MSGTCVCVLSHVLKHFKHDKRKLKTTVFFEDEARLVAKIGITQQHTLTTNKKLLPRMMGCASFNPEY